MQRLRPHRNAGDHGIIATHMAITVAFALFAVVQLTRTTLSAQQIDTRVSDIVNSVDTIDTATIPVALLDETGDTTDEILAAAKNLNGQAQEVTKHATTIDGHVKDILSSANTINSSVVDINSNVREINTTARAINKNASEILGSFQRLSPVVVSIHDGVAAINGQADRIIALSQGIKSDTGNILAAARDVNAHAKSIDCSSLIRGSACNQP
ncbi:MAG: hypothetical protein WD794_14350 [Mycobacteriales bacterium]